MMSIYRKALMYVVQSKHWAKHCAHAQQAKGQQWFDVE